MLNKHPRQASKLLPMTQKEKQMANITSSLAVIAIQEEIMDKAEDIILELKEPIEKRAKELYHKDGNSFKRSTSTIKFNTTRKEFGETFLYFVIHDSYDDSHESSCRFNISEFENLEIEKS